MAATKTWNCDDYFSVDKLKEWPEPESVSLMEVLAREDIDEAVHAILFRENYIVKRMDTYIQHQAVFKERRKEMLHKKWVENVARPLQQKIIEKVISYRRPGQSQVKYEYCLKHMDKPTKASPMCECLFRRQQELREAKGTSYQHGTGKQNDMQKEPKETKKGPLFSKSPKFMATSHGIVPKERQRASAQPVWNKLSLCSSEKPVCTSKSHLPQEEKTCNISQIVFERQFRSSKLSPKKKEAEKKGQDPVTRLSLTVECKCAQESSPEGLNTVEGSALGTASHLYHTVKVSGTRPQRPRSWAAADSHHSQGPPAVGRRVMTAELLGKHLASLQGAARMPLSVPRSSPAHSSDL